MSDSNTSVVGGGGYVEDPDFVPNPTDLEGQYNTSGTGAHQNVDATTSLYALDRKRIADQALRALDPRDHSVNRRHVIMPNDQISNEEAVEYLTNVAQDIVEQDVAIGEPGPAEAAAGKDDDRNPSARIVEGGTSGASPEPVGVTSTQGQAGVVGKESPTKDEVKAETKQDPASVKAARAQRAAAQRDDADKTAADK